MSDHNTNTPNRPSLFSNGVDHNDSVRDVHSMADREEIVVGSSEFHRHNSAERRDSRLGLIVKLLLLFAVAAIIGFFLSGKFKGNTKDKEL
ncbi:MAG: hypothetical protein AAGF06_06425, partial [Pseudomonadota bacterium]